MSLKNKLKAKLGSRVVVVMVDGRYLRGILRAVEEGLVVLDTVEETSGQDIEWKKGAGVLSGRHIWSRIDLSEVYINMDNIIRVWPWPEEETKDGVSSGAETSVVGNGGGGEGKKAGEDRNVYFREVGVM